MDQRDVIWIDYVLYLFAIIKKKLFWQYFTILKQTYSIFLSSSENINLSFFFSHCSARQIKTRDKTFFECKQFQKESRGKLDFFLETVNIKPFRMWLFSPVNPLHDRHTFSLASSLIKYSIRNPCALWNIPEIQFHQSPESAGATKWTLNTIFNF